VSLEYKIFSKLEMGATRIVNPAIVFDRFKKLETTEWEKNQYWVNVTFVYTWRYERLSSYIPQ
jgi:hypothetical protein